MARKTLDRTGETKKNNFGSIITIIEYNGATNILIEFENGYKVNSVYDAFKNGEIKSPYERRTYGIGYLGEGSFIRTINGKMTIDYSTWHEMIKRCYSNNYIKKFPTYTECSVDENWHNYQMFAKWFQENYYEIKGEQMHLDKDILHKGNKIYSSRTCIFVPEGINELFTKNNINRGKYPIGVIKRKDTGRFEAHCNNGNKKQIYLGCFNTQEQAFQAYKKCKEKIIKQKADEYKDGIPKELYEALYKYQVEITD